MVCGVGLGGGSKVAGRHGELAPRARGIRASVYGFGDSRPLIRVETPELDRETTLLCEVAPNARRAIYRGAGASKACSAGNCGCRGKQFTDDGDRGVAGGAAARVAFHAREAKNERVEPRG